MMNEIFQNFNHSLWVCLLFVVTLEMIAKPFQQNPSTSRTHFHLRVIISMTDSSDLPSLKTLRISDVCCYYMGRVIIEGD